MWIWCPYSPVREMPPPGKPGSNMDEIAPKMLADHKVSGNEFRKATGLGTRKNRV